jgi:hypothetical protein
MTYLELINNVLRRLREDTISEINETSYATMVGDFVNDAKRLCEDATDWSALRQTLQVETTAGTFSYVLTGSQNRGKVLDVVNDTSNFFMEYKTAHDFNRRFLIDEPERNSPRYYSFNGVDSSGDTQVDVFPIPDKQYFLNFNMVIKQGDLVNSDDLLKIPPHPVIHLAVALLARERGETGGTSTPEYFSIADKYLSDAVALDASKHPEEMVWYY